MITDNVLRTIQVVGGLLTILLGVHALWGLVKSGWKQGKKVFLIEMGSLIIILLVGVYAFSARPLEVNSNSCTSRPCVFAEVIEFSDDYSSVDIGFHNSGQVVAMMVRIRAGLFASNDFDPNTFKSESLPTDPTSASSASLPPQAWGKAPLHLTNALTIDMGNDIQNGKVRAYVIGQIDYKDPIGNMYSPRFCWTWNMTAKTFIHCPENAFVDGQKQ